MSLIFAASSFNKLDEDTKDYLIMLYHKYYEITYGMDAFDVFLKVTKTSINDYKMALNNDTNNYKKAINSLSDNTLVMLIYNNEMNIIGCSRIKENKNDIRVLDIVFDNLEKSQERDYWVETVSFLEAFYKSKGYNKMYLEIPLKEGPLLVRASDLGFIEDPNDIELDANTYVLNKVIGSNKNE